MKTGTATGQCRDGWEPCWRPTARPGFPNVKVATQIAREFYRAYVAPGEQAPDHLADLLGPTAVIVAVAGRRVELGNGWRMRVEADEWDDLVMTAKMWPVWIQQVEEEGGDLVLTFVSGVARHVVAGTVEHLPTPSKEPASHAAF